MCHFDCINKVSKVHSRLHENLRLGIILNQLFRCKRSIIEAQCISQTHKAKLNTLSRRVNISKVTQSLMTEMRTCSEISFMRVHISNSTGIRNLRLCLPSCPTVLFVLRASAAVQSCFLYFLTVFMHQNRVSVENEYKSATLTYGSLYVTVSFSYYSYLDPESLRGRVTLSSARKL